MDKKVLREGKCDQVPGHIHKMRVEWLGQRTPAQLPTLPPDYALTKYFLYFGQPDLTKTTFIVGIPLERDSDAYSEEMTKVAKNTAGLYHKKALAPKTHTLFMGWESDATAMEKAASGHVAQEEKSLDIDHSHTPREFKNWKALRSTPRVRRKI